MASPRAPPPPVSLRALFVHATPLAVVLTHVCELLPPAGFFAFRTPVPTDVTESLSQTIYLFARRSHNGSLPRGSRYGPNQGDQDLINIALRENDRIVRCPRRYKGTRADKSKKPSTLLIHPDWHTNVGAGSYTKWHARARVLHWGGVPKPWASGEHKRRVFPGWLCSFTCQQEVNKSRVIWQSQCQITQVVATKLGAESQVRC